MPPRFAPRTLAQWPWVVVRVDCVLCTSKGCYRLARLAAKYGPEQSVDGLLRDLAQDCPWFNDRPRKYEPRCGARFVDLERAFPPADHPDAPIYRQRQPAREDLPKPNREGRFPATYEGGAPALSNWPDAELLLSCKVCVRREVYVVADLRTMYGADMLLTNVRTTLSAECPLRQMNALDKQCGALLFRVGHA